MKVETQERILNKANELFMRYGIRSVSMDDIARELAISKKTIYQYFKDKDNLVLGVSETHFTKDKCGIEAIEQQASNALEEMISISKHIRASFMNINPVVFFDLKKYHPKAWALFQQHRQNFIIKKVEQNLRNGIKEGLYRDDIDVEVLAILRVEQVELAFDMTLFPPQRFNFIEVQMQFIEHFIRGIVTNKGFQILEDYKQQLNNK